MLNENGNTSKYPFEKRTDTKLFDIENNRVKPVWVSTSEAAAYLGIPVGSLRNLTSNGKIPYCKLGRLNRYLLSDLDRVLLENRQGGINGY